jgi:hypothetical protein
MVDEDSSQDEWVELVDTALDPVKPIPMDLFAKKQNKTTHLIDNVDPERVMKGRHEWYHFALEEPVFVSVIEVFAEGYNYKSCEFSWQPLRQSMPTSGHVTFDGTKFSHTINDIITGFSFRPDAKYLGGAQIARVVANGFKLSELDNSLSQLADLEGARQRAVRSAKALIEEGKKSEEEAAHNRSAVSAMKEEADTLETTIKDRSRILKETNDKVDASNTEVAKLRIQQDSIEARIEQQNATIEQRTIERSQISKDISEKSSELKDLETNIYLFPSEIKDFSEKAGRDKSFYWKLAAVPIGVVTVMAIALLKNAADLTTIIDEQDNARLLSIFVTRAPYVAIAGAIIGVMYKLSKSLVAEIMRIDNQTRSLAKVSIIATDVSAASAEKLDLSDEERYHLRTGLKMDLLREHLKSYIPEDYNYLESDRVSSRLKQIKDEEKINNEVESVDDAEPSSEDEVAP